MSVDPLTVDPLIRERHPFALPLTPDERDALAFWLGELLLRRQHARADFDGPLDPASEALEAEEDGRIRFLRDRVDRLEGAA